MARSTALIVGLGLMTASPGGAFAKDAAQNGCVPDRGQITRAEVGLTRLLTPRGHLNALFLCRPGHPLVSLVANPSELYGGPIAETRVERVAGPYILFSAESYEARTYTFTLIDGRDLTVAYVGNSSEGAGGNLPAFSAEGVVAYETSTAGSDGRYDSSITTPDGTVLDAGPDVSDLVVSGATASWQHADEAQRRSATVAARPDLERASSSIFSRVPKRIVHRSKLG